MNHYTLFFFFLTALFLPVEMSGAGREPISAEVNSSKELKEALSQAKPGVIIILNDGHYGDSNFLISKNGTSEQQIVVKAKNNGAAFIESALKIDGNYISIRGINFIQNGNLTVFGKGCRISGCTWNNAKPGKWLHVLAGSSEIEIDHNTFQNKTFSNQHMDKSCQLLKIDVRNKNERHHIHHNLFKDVAKGKTGNGYETIQLITENNPFDPPPGNSNSLIEDNLFIRCNGEAEIISVKSNGNVLRRNTFRECKGGLVLRHGDDNTVTQNYFFGAGESGSYGVRIQGTGQVVASNYFQDLGSMGLGMMDGTPDDLYIRVERGQILFNSFINCSNAFVIGLNHSKHPNGAVPKDCNITGNIFFSEKEDKSESFIVFIQDDEPENWEWKDNMGFGKTIPSINGIELTDPELEKNDHAFMVPTVRTKSFFISNNLDEKLKFDLFGNPWKENRTVGAVQFPFKTANNLPLSEDKVGAHNLE